MEYFVPFGGFSDDGMTTDPYNSEQCPFVGDKLGDDAWCDAVSSQVAPNASEPLGDDAWYDAMSSFAATDELVPLVCLAARAACASNRTS